MFSGDIKIELWSEIGLKSEEEDKQENVFN